MAIYKVQGPDGQIHKFEGPDGATPEEVTAAASSMFGDKVSDKSLSDLVTGDVSAPTDDSRLRAVALGASKPLDNLSSFLTQNVPGMAQADRWLADVTGLPDVATDNARNEAARANNSRTGYQMVGNVVGTLPTAPLKGGQVIQGGLTGALLTDETTPMGVAKDVAIGAGTAVAGGKILGAIGEGLRPVVDKGVTALREAGVPLTLGQIAGSLNETASGAAKLAGKTVRGIEDRLEGLPGIGNAIRNAKTRGIEGYNETVLNRALNKIGEQLPKGMAMGREAVEYTGDKISQAYDNLLPKLSARADMPFAQEMTAIKDKLSVLPEETQRQFSAILNRAFGNRRKDGVLAGRNLKDAESLLGKYATDFTGSSDANSRLLGEALRDAQGSLRSLVERSNPKFTGELQKANAAWRELTIAEKAAGAAGNQTGVFTPKGYAAAARAADKTARKRATARGTTPNQELTDAAARILPNSVPDSGTAGRGALAAMLAGHFGGIPVIAGASAAALPYTKAGQNFLQTLLLAQRPEALRKATAGASYLSPYVLPALAVGD